MDLQRNNKKVVPSIFNVTPTWHTSCRWCQWYQTQSPASPPSRRLLPPPCLPLLAKRLHQNLKMSKNDSKECFDLEDKSDEKCADKPINKYSGCVKDMLNLSYCKMHTIRGLKSRGKKLKLVAAPKQNCSDL